MKASRIGHRLPRSSSALGAALVLELVGGASAFAQSAPAQDTEALAKQLSNPVASLISVPFQFNMNHGLGPEDEGRQFLLNFQPVLPFKVNDDCNLIARIIVPMLAQPVLSEGGAPSNGIGDILFSAFFSPRKGGLISGVGPAFGRPISSDPTLGSGKYALGPTAVGLPAKPTHLSGLRAGRRTWADPSGPSRSCRSSSRAASRKN